MTDLLRPAGQMNRQPGPGWDVGAGPASVHGYELNVQHRNGDEDIAEHATDGGDSWQCDAHGRYSGFPPPDPSVIVTEVTAPRTEYLSDQTFLAGDLIREPSSPRPGRDTTNDTDEMFPTGGSPALLDTTPINDGYRAAITFIVPTEKALDPR